MHLRCSMQEAEQMGFVDSLLLLESIYNERQRELKFEAALHDKKLR